MSDSQISRALHSAGSTSMPMKQAASPNILDQWRIKRPESAHQVIAHCRAFLRQFVLNEDVQRLEPDGCRQRDCHQTYCRGRPE